MTSGQTCRAALMGRTAAVCSLERSHPSACSAWPACRAECCPPHSTAQHQQWLICGVGDQDLTLDLEPSAFPTGNSAHRPPRPEQEPGPPSGTWAPHRGASWSAAYFPPKHGGFVSALTDRGSSWDGTPAFGCQNKVPQESSLITRGRAQPRLVAGDARCVTGSRVLLGACLVHGLPSNSQILES